MHIDGGFLFWAEQSTQQTADGRIGFRIGLWDLIDGRIERESDGIRSLKKLRLKIGFFFL